MRNLILKHRLSVPKSRAPYSHACIFGTLNRAVYFQTKYDLRKNPSDVTTLQTVKQEQTSFAPCKTRTYQRCARNIL